MSSYRVGKVNTSLPPFPMDTNLTHTTTEVAVSGRAGCSNTACKNKESKIAKGELRQGVLVTIREHQSWKWRHWCGLLLCATYALSFITNRTQGMRDAHCLAQLVGDRQ